MLVAEQRLAQQRAGPASGEGQQLQAGDSITQTVTVQPTTAQPRTSQFLITGDNVGDFTSPEVDDADFECDNVFSRSQGAIS